MRALDTNMLVYAEVRTCPQHARALAILRECTHGAAAWALPWPCIYEFLRVITHARIFHPRISVDVALADLRAILRSPSLILLTETPDHADVMERIVRSSGASGNLIHDAHIAALCIEHGVTELVTGDRDFHRFQGLRVVDPFAA